MGDAATHHACAYLPSRLHLATHPLAPSHPARLHPTTQPRAPSGPNPQPTGAM